jgi:hypothetical protein
MNNLCMRGETAGGGGGGHPIKSIQPCFKQSLHHNLLMERMMVPEHHLSKLS